MGENSEASGKTLGEPELLPKVLDTLGHTYNTEYIPTIQRFLEQRKAKQNL